MGTKSIRHIVEAVLSGFLASETGLFGVNMYTGDSASVMELPKAVVLCDSAKPPADIPECLGNYACSVRISLFSNADDTTLADHRSRCAALAGRMADLDAIQTAFTTSGDASCYDVSVMSEDEGVDERSWVTTFAFEVLVVLPE